jgi:hypothetical protein
MQMESINDNITHQNIFLFMDSWWNGHTVEQGDALNPEMNIQMLMSGISSLLQIQWIVTYRKY